MLRPLLNITRKKQAAKKMLHDDLPLIYPIRKRKRKEKEGQLFVGHAFRSKDELIIHVLLLQNV